MVNNTYICVYVCFLFLRIGWMNVFSFSQDFLLYRDPSLTTMLTTLCSLSLTCPLQFIGKNSCLDRGDFLETFKMFCSFLWVCISELLVEVPQLQRWEKPETSFKYLWCCVNWKEMVRMEGPGWEMRPFGGIPRVRYRNYPGDAQSMLKRQDRNITAVRAHMGIICIKGKVEVWL